MTDTVGRIQQLTREIRDAGPFESARLAKQLAEEVDHGRHSLTAEERETCQEAAAESEWSWCSRGPLLAIIARLTGERFGADDE